MTLRDSLYTMAKAAQDAARPLARATAQARSAAILAAADGLNEASSAILAANAADLRRAREQNLAAAMLDRLTLDPQRLKHLETAMREIAAQPDPLGAVSRAWARPNGLQIEKVRLPLGVILMIYEARPNVTLDAAALAIRSGNAVILRGGSEAAETNAALLALLEAALRSAGLPAAAVQRVPTQAHEAIDILLQFDDCINLVIPRGGEALIRRVTQNSRIAVVRHYKGVCHVYVDAAAHLEMAQDIVENSKIPRPGVCNALETLLVARQIAPQFLPRCIKRLREAGVTLRGCAATRALVSDVEAATDADWDTEFLDLVLAIKVVDDVDAAIAHIDRHGTQHTASIVTEEPAAASRFCAQVDCSCVLVNASTRFNDGGELGLGAEMGISTTRIHAYGAMGAEALTAEKYVVRGQGQVRK